MFTSQMIVTGTVKPKEIVQTGVDSHGEAIHEGVSAAWGEGFL
jgi:hypothetical protein